MKSINTVVQRGRQALVAAHMDGTLLANSPYAEFTAERHRLGEPECKQQRLNMSVSDSKTYALSTMPRALYLLTEGETWVSRKNWVSTGKV